MKENKKIVVYVDLDNTLVDFKSGIRQMPKETLKKYDHDEKGKPHYDDIPGIFAVMKPMKGAKKAFAFLTSNFDTYILSTAPWENPLAWSDKLLWVKRHLGKPAYKRLILSHHKDLLRGDYIIDDSTKNGVAEFQGTHIHFGQGEFKDWPAVIDYFKKIAESE